MHIVDIVILGLSITLCSAGLSDVNIGLKSPFFWQLSSPLLSPADRPEDPCFSVKDPTAVNYDGKWHVFCTIRSVKRTHQIEYVSFDKWENANNSPRHLLTTGILFYPA